MRYLYNFLLCLGMLICFGCSPRYKDFEPVTKEEALSYVDQQIALIEQGDKSSILNAGMDIDASAAVYYVAGKDIPSIAKNPSRQERLQRDEFVKKVNNGLADSLEKISLKEIKEYGNTYVVVLECVCVDSKTNTRRTKNYSYNLLKNKKTGEILFAGCGTKW
ncbi:MAG: hypothetical protein Q4G68_06555 [Planctomycetia bacterium]|nr:hypothetical protein [Planctomycetia bacterium]